jgi:hypothetical protein
MKIIKSTLPPDSVLKSSKLNYHYVDSYLGFFADSANTVTSADVGKAFFSSGPQWIGKLFTLRNKIVSLFGLKTPGNLRNREQQLTDFKCEPGEQLGLFKVIDRNAKEVVLGEDDKHLNFRVSMFVEEADVQGQRKLIISTTVIFNNRWGRLYFLPVKPFHSIIVPTMLKGIIKNLKKQNY